MKNFANIFGWYGAAAILLAYMLISFAVLNPNNLWYQILNVTGGAGLTTIAYVKKDWQLVIVNAIWAIVGAVALVKLFF